MAPALKSCFERTINLKVNNLNFGSTIYFKESGRSPGSKPLGATLLDDIDERCIFESEEK